MEDRSEKEFKIRDLQYQHRSEVEKISKLEYFDFWYDLSLEFVTTKWFSLLNVLVFISLHILLGFYWSIRPSIATAGLAFMLSCVAHPMYLRQKLAKEMKSHPDMHDNFYAFWTRDKSKRRLLEVCHEKTNDLAGVIAIRKDTVDDSVAKLSHHYVLKDFRSFQLEESLVKAGEEIATDWGCSRIFVEITLINDSAIALYKGLGYTLLWSQFVFVIYPGYNMSVVHLSKPLW